VMLSCGLSWVRVFVLWVGYGLIEKIWVLLLINPSGSRYSATTNAYAIQISYIAI